MLQKLGALLIILISLAESANAIEFSKNNVYIGGGLGLFTGQKFENIEKSPYLNGKAKAKPRILYNLFVGYNFDKYLRADINSQYRRYKYDASIIANEAPDTSNQTIKNFSVFLNGYINIPNKTIFVPYITAGVGYSCNNPSSLKFESSGDPDFNVDAPGKRTNHFAWNAGLGARIQIHKNVRIGLSYRYANLGQTKIKSTQGEEPSAAASQKLRTHQVLLNLYFG